MEKEKKIKCWVIVEKKFDVEIDIFPTMKGAADCAAEYDSCLETLFTLTVNIAALEAGTRLFD